MRFSCAILLLCFSLGSFAFAAEPNLRALSPHGLQVGATTTLVIDGDDLGTAPRLLLPFEAKQTLQTTGTDKRATFEVALGNEVAPGYYHVRVVTTGGVSLPALVSVDRLPQQPFAAAASPLPAALNGIVAGSAVLETTFIGKAKQKIMLEVEAQRLGSKLRPVLHLYGPDGLQLGWSWPTPTLVGDTRLEATLPVAGTYKVSLHDAEYAAAAEGFFRLKLGRWDAVDAVFPPVIGYNVKEPATVELLGPSLTKKVDVPEVNSFGPAILPWPKEGTWSGPRPWVDWLNRKELLAAQVAGKSQELPEGAVGVSGKLLAPYEEHRYRVPVKAGTKVRLAVFCERLGSPLDAALTIRTEAGVLLTRSEDSPGTLDPMIEYDVPAKTTALVVGVVDAQGRGGPRGVYWLSIDPPAEEDGLGGDFALSTLTARLAIPAGGRVVFPVLVERKGYTADIILRAEGLPDGFELGNMIDSGAEGALLEVFYRGPGGAPAVIHFYGITCGGHHRPVVVAGHPLEHLQPWLATELAIAPLPAAKDAFSIDWNKLPADTELTPGGKLALPVKVVRPASNAVVQLSLLTSQRVPLLNGRPNPLQAIRAASAKPVELAAKATDGVIPIVVPAVLASPSYDLAVKAELLSADKKTVLATAYTPVRRLTVLKTKK